MQFETTVTIDAEQQDVWAALVDVEHWPEWTESMNEVRWDDGSAVAVGNRALVKQPSLPTTRWTVTELDEGSAFSWQTSSPGVRTLGTHGITPGGDGGTTLTLGIQQSGALAGVVAALFGARTRRYVRMEAEGLKAAAEARRAGREPSSAAEAA
jgi:uncharacterized membrane protein